jgi:hypothetical protein
MTSTLQVDGFRWATLSGSFDDLGEPPKGEWIRTSHSRLEWFKHGNAGKSTLVRDLVWTKRAEIAVLLRSGYRLASVKVVLGCRDSQFYPVSLIWLLRFGGLGQKPSGIIPIRPRSQ